MSEYDDLLLDAYRGEVFGAAFFAALSATADDVRHRDCFRTLEQIEAQTASRLRPLVDAAGLDRGDDRAREEGDELAKAAREAAWTDFLTGLRGALPSFLEKFLRLQSIAADPADETLADLVAHEQAIDRFAELELAGDTEAAIAVLQGHLAAPQPS